MSTVRSMYFVTATRLPQDGRVKWETMRVFATDYAFDAFLVYGAILGANRMRSVALTSCHANGKLITMQTYQSRLSDPTYWETSEGTFEATDCHQGTARNWYAGLEQATFQEVHPWIFLSMPHLQPIFTQSGIDPGIIAASVSAVADGVSPEGHGAHT